jgi:hypothetical protein
MRKTALIGLAIVILASLAAGVLTAFAQSTPQPQSSSPDPRPGYTYFVVYRQSDGFIVYAVGCPPSPAVCTPTLQSGQSVMYITDQPVLVKQLFADAYNSNLGNWHVNLQAHQLATTGTTSSASIAPGFGVSLFGTLLPAFASLGVATSGSLIWRRARRRA